MDESQVNRGRAVSGPVNEKRYVSRWVLLVEQPRSGSWPFDLMPEQGWPAAGS